MIVCKYCLMGIESHEGKQHKVRLSWDTTPAELIHENENGEETVTCEWCDEESPLYESFEI